MKPLPTDPEERERERQRRAMPPNRAEQLAQMERDKKKQEGYKPPPPEERDDDTPVEPIKQENTPESPGS